MVATITPFWIQLQSVFVGVHRENDLIFNAMLVQDRGDFLPAQVPPGRQKRRSVPSYRFRGLRVAVSKATRESPFISTTRMILIWGTLPVRRDSLADALSGWIVRV